MGTQLCSTCFRFSAEDPCPICKDDSRDSSTVAVVAEDDDVQRIEKSSFNGCYHVLHGLVSPRDGIGPEQLTIRQLIDRVRRGGITELVLWLPHGMEGDATAMYIDEALKSANLVRPRFSRSKRPPLSDTDPIM
jgi:recombination protein RecR